VQKTSSSPLTKPVLVYADGSCLGNPGPGGWGVVVVEPDGTERELGGGDPNTTNNRMEITAAIKGLQQTGPGATVILRSDSQYLVNTINLGWKRNKNLELWKQLDEEIGKRKVKFEWVMGHAGDPRNERADALAVEAAQDTAGSKTSGARVSARELQELLGAGETIRRCAGCGREFVSTGDNYCSLVECRLKARRAPK
jgi:ribonuclease HI